MPYCQTYLPTLCFSCFGLDPETPAADYEIHFVRTQDAAYIPPDSEAWLLFYAAALEAIKHFPAPSTPDQAILISRSGPLARPSRPPEPENRIVSTTPRFVSST